MKTLCKEEFTSCEIVKENQQLQNNWNELKKWLEEKEQEYKKDCYAAEYDFVIGFIMGILDKMTELERGEE